MDKHIARRRNAVMAWLNEKGFDVEACRPPCNWPFGEDSFYESGGAVSATLDKFTGHGDYVGGTVERSNCECMLEDFPHLLTTTSSHFNYEAVSVLDPFDLHKAFHWPNHPQHEKAVDLIEGVDALHDYPCWDDERLSALEIELINEALPDKIEEIWSKATQGWDTDLIPFPASLKEEMEKAITGSDGQHVPVIETGCIVSFDDRAEKDALEKAAEFFAKWKGEVSQAVMDDETEDSVRAAVEDEVAEEHRIPHLPTDAIDAVEKIRAAIENSNPILALEEIARILNHPAVK